MPVNRKANKPLILFKYGGNAMTDDSLKKQVLKNIISLHDKGYHVVIVHGGGPFIKQALKDAKIESEFIDGHRKTTKEAFEYVEMALKGKANGELVSLINSMGKSAAGISGKDGRTVIARKRMHKRVVAGKSEDIDLGQVGDVESVNTRLLDVLLENDFIPVIACLAADEIGDGYNINGDMFAGHIAGALKAKEYVVLTDVNGLLRDKSDPDSLMEKLERGEILKLMEGSIIQGGMIPKVESCKIALEKGAESSRIINGTIPGQILSIADGGEAGTVIF